MFYFKERKPFTFTTALDEIWVNACLHQRCSFGTSRQVANLNLIK
jgi:hypothetical protein